MRCFEDLRAAPLSPLLIPTFKQPERQLLSVFMALLEVSPTLRGRFLALCQYRSGKTCAFTSAMEPQYQNPKFPEVRPDGLLGCVRGTKHWSAFIEAKANKNHIRPEQIQSYLELAKLLGVSAVISISNEFARSADGPPYFIAAKHTRGVDLYHFAWADIRTLISFVLAEEELEPAEAFVLRHGSLFFWSEKSGVTTYDAMPESWRGFVDASGTALGFGQNQKGLSEIVYGWQQERRDLCSKLSHELLEPVELRHAAGARLTDEDRTKADRKLLADDYRLGATYRFASTKSEIELLCALRSCRIEVAVSLALPDGPAAKGTLSWLKKKVESAELSDSVVSIDWPGRTDDTTVSMLEFLRHTEDFSEGQKAAPKGIKLIFGLQDTRRFKSRKFFVQDVERLALEVATRMRAAGLV